MNFLAKAAEGLDQSRLVNAKIRSGKLIAQCPACAAAGGDRSGQHLVIFDGGAGKWGCVKFSGDVAHRREIAAALGMGAGRQLRPRSRPPICAPSGEIVRKLQLPLVREPTIGELAQIARTRGLPFFAGLELAARAGMLAVGVMSDAGEVVAAWILTDSARRCAQARRLDGKPWQSIGDAKAKTLPGSEACWPIGAANIGERPSVALCEGGPDVLAAWSIAWWEGKADKIAPVCITGAGNRIHPDALPYFRGKRIWLFSHRDTAGERARLNWTAQLIDAGACLVVPFDVAPHKDLNEWLAAFSGKIGGES